MSSFHHSKTQSLDRNERTTKDTNHTNDATTTDDDPKKNSTTRLTSLLPAGRGGLQNPKRSNDNNKAGASSSSLLGLDRLAAAKRRERQHHRRQYNETPLSHPGGVNRDVQARARERHQDYQRRRQRDRGDDRQYSQGSDRRNRRNDREAEDDEYDDEYDSRKRRHRDDDDDDDRRRGRGGSRQRRRYDSDDDGKDRYNNTRKDNDDGRSRRRSDDRQYSKSHNNNDDDDKEDRQRFSSSSSRGRDLHSANRRRNDYDRYEKNDNDNHNPPTRDRYSQRRRTDEERDSDRRRHSSSDSRQQQPRRHGERDRYSEHRRPRHTESLPASSSMPPPPNRGFSSGNTAATGRSTSQRRPPTGGGLVHRATTGRPQSSWDRETPVPRRRDDADETLVGVRNQNGTADDNDNNDDDDSFDRQFYLQEDEGHYVQDAQDGQDLGRFLYDSAKMQAREEEMEQRRRNRQNLRQAARQDDQDAWEQNRLRVSGATTQGELSLEAMNATDLDTRTTLLVHQVKPPFLDGRVSFSKIREAVPTVKDASSDFAKMAREGSETLRMLRAKKEKNAMRQKFWELGGTRMGEAMGVKKTVKSEDGSSTTEAVTADGEIDYKKSSGFAEHMKGQKDGAVSKFAKEKSIRQQREFLPVFTVREQLLQVIRENNVVIIVGETGSGKVSVYYMFITCINT